MEVGFFELSYGTRFGLQGFKFADCKAAAVQALDKNDATNSLLVLFARNKFLPILLNDGRGMLSSHIAEHLDSLPATRTALQLDNCLAGSNILLATDPFSQILLNTDRRSLASFFLVMNTGTPTTDILLEQDDRLTELDESFAVHECSDILLDQDDAFNQAIHSMLFKNRELTGAHEDLGETQLILVISDMKFLENINGDIFGWLGPVLALNEEIVLFDEFLVQHASRITGTVNANSLENTTSAKLLQYILSFIVESDLGLIRFDTTNIMHFGVPNSLHEPDERSLEYRTKRRFLERTSTHAKLTSTFLRYQFAQRRNGRLTSAALVT